MCIGVADRVAFKTRRSPLGPALSLRTSGALSANICPLMIYSRLQLPGALTLLASNLGSGRHDPPLYRALDRGTERPHVQK